MSNDSSISAEGFRKLSSSQQEAVFHKMADELKALNGQVASKKRPDLMEYDGEVFSQFRRWQQGRHRESIASSLKKAGIDL